MKSNSCLTRKASFALQFIFLWLTISFEKFISKNDSLAELIGLTVLLLLISYNMLANRPIVLVPMVSNRVWSSALAILLVGHLCYAALCLNRLGIAKVDSPTLSAGAVMVEGGDPYRATIDTRAVHLLERAKATAHPEHFGGYKFLPLMPAAYLPLGLALGVRGLVLTNLILTGLLLWGVWRLANALAYEDIARWAVLFIGTLPVLPFELYAKDVTDIVSVVPLVLAVPLIDRRPAIAGLLVGLSLSATPLPALLLLPLFIPAAKAARRRYILLAAIGLIPDLVYFSAAPSDFIDNVVMFDVVRPIDATSWLAGRSAPTTFVLRMVLLVLCAMAAAFVTMRRPTIGVRCGCAALILIAAILVGNGIHESYMLWWIPFATAVLWTSNWDRMPAIRQLRGPPQSWSRSSRPG